MKKYLIPLLIIVFIASMLFTGVGCKTNTAVITTIAETAAAATTAPETTEAATETTQAPKEKVELIWWHPSFEDLNPYQNVVAELNKLLEPDNIVVKFEGQPSDNWYELLKTTAISKTGPDMIGSFSGIGDIVGHGEDEIVMPLNNILPNGMKDKIITWDGVTDIKDGNIYGVPYSLGYYALVYNKKLFDKAGIDYSNMTEPLYWDSMLDICAKLKAAGITPWGFANKEGYAAEWWTAWGGISYFDSSEQIFDYFQNKSMNSSPFRDMWEKVKEMYDKGYLFEGGENLDSGTYHVAQFTGGEVAMIHQSPSGFADIEKKMGPENIGYGFWPIMSKDGKLNTKYPGIFNFVFGITSWTKHEKEAMRVIEVLTTTQEGSDLLWAIGHVPMMKGYVAKYEDPASPRAKDEPKLLEYMNKNGAASILIEAYGNAFEQTQWKFENLYLTGGITFEEFAAELDALRGIK